MPTISTVHFDWQQQGNEYYANTDHGKVIITEARDTVGWRFGNAASHKPRIEHSSGAVIHGIGDVDFEAAEAWIVSKLHELDHPTGYETDLENLDFTLSICVRLLPEDSDPIHYLRLKWIENRIGAILL